MNYSELRTGTEFTDKLKDFSFIAINKYVKLHLKSEMPNVRVISTIVDDEGQEFFERFEELCYEKNWEGTDEIKVGEKKDKSRLVHFKEPKIVMNQRKSEIILIGNIEDLNKIMK